MGNFSYDLPADNRFRSRSLGLDRLSTFAGDADPSYFRLFRKKARAVLKRRLAQILDEIAAETSMREQRFRNSRCREVLQEAPAGGKQLPFEPDDYEMVRPA